MASNTNPLHTGNSAGEEPVDLAKLITQTVENYNKELLAKNPNSAAGVIQQPVNTGEPQPLRMNIDGEERIFATPTEVAKFFVERDRTRQAAAAAAVAAAGNGRQGEDPNANKPEEIKPDVRKFADLLVENPGKAVEHAMSEAMGIQNPFGLVKALGAKVIEQEQRLAVMDFKNSHPEYDPTPENREAMSKIIQEFGLPVNEKGLELAYSVAVSRGFIKPSQEETQTQPQEEQPQNTAWSQTYGGTQETGREAPPHARRNAAQTPGINFDALEDLPTAEVEKLYHQYKGLVDRGLAR